jgi:hypothetical protein
MITAIIETRNQEVSLAHLLAALVPAATEGVIRDVVVVDHGSDDGTREVADAAGCVLIDGSAETDALSTAVAHARGDWLLFAPVTHLFQPEWQEDALAFIQRTAISSARHKRSATFHAGRLSSGPFAWLRVLVRSDDTARLVAKSDWLAQRSTMPASAASRVSGVRRGAA